MKKLLTTCAALLGLSPLLLPALGETADATQLLAATPNAAEAVLILQKQLAQHPIVLLVRLAPAGGAQASVLECYKGPLAAGTGVRLDPPALPHGKQADTAYVLARAARSLDGGGAELQDCLVVPRYTQGSTAQAAMHAALVRAQLIKVQEER